MTTVHPIRGLVIEALTSTGHLIVVLPGKDSGSRVHRRGSPGRSMRAVSGLVSRTTLRSTGQVLQEVTVNKVTAVMVSKVTAVMVNKVTAVMVSKVTAVILSKVTAVMVSKVTAVVVSKVTAAMVNKVTAAMVSKVTAVMVIKVTAVMVSKVMENKEGQGRGIHPQDVTTTLHPHLAPTLNYL